MWAGLQAVSAHLDHSNEHNSLVRPRLRPKTMSNIRYTNRTPNLARPFSRNHGVQRMAWECYHERCWTPDREGCKLLKRAPRP